MEVENDKRIQEAPDLNYVELRQEPCFSCGIVIIGNGL